jgi:hypothetical protein
LAKYRKINKTPLRDSIIAGLIFGIVAHIYVYILFDADTQFFYPIEYTPAFTTFLAGSFFWHLMFWNRRPTVYNGIYVGVLSVIASHILFWCISILYIWIGESLSYGQTSLEFIIGLLGVIIILPVSAMTMVFVSSLFVPMIIITTIIIGGVTGGLIAYIYKKKEKKIVNIGET